MPKSAKRSAKRSARRSARRSPKWSLKRHNGSFTPRYRSSSIRSPASLIDDTSETVQTRSTPSIPLSTRRASTPATVSPRGPTRHIATPETVSPRGPPIQRSFAVEREIHTIPTRATQATPQHSSVEREGINPRARQLEFNDPNNYEEINKVKDGIHFSKLELIQTLDKLQSTLDNPGLSDVTLIDIGYELIDIQYNTAAYAQELLKQAKERS